MEFQRDEYAHAFWLFTGLDILNVEIKLIFELVCDSKASLWAFDFVSLATHIVSKLCVAWQTLLSFALVISHTSDRVIFKFINCWLSLVDWRCGTLVGLLSSD